MLTIANLIWHDFKHGLALLTRIPVKLEPKHLQSRGALAFWSFPVVGLIIGSMVFSVIYAGANYLPAAILAILATVTSVMLTGAIHDDGLADCADGFWGARKVRRRLEIMKDSSIGTYGTSALILTNLLRIACLFSVIEAGATLLLIPVYIASRYWIVGIMWAYPHARSEGLAVHVGKTQQITVINGGIVTLGLAAFFGTTAIAAAALSALGALFVINLAMRKIRGFTGDVLGAAQVVAELTGLLALVILL